MLTVEGVEVPNQLNLMGRYSALDRYVPPTGTQIVGWWHFQPGGVQPSSIDIAQITTSIKQWNLPFLTVILNRQGNAFARFDFNIGIIPIQVEADVIIEKWRDDELDKQVRATYGGKLNKGSPTESLCQLQKRVVLAQQIHAPGRVGLAAKKYLETQQEPPDSCEHELFERDLLPSTAKESKSLAKRLAVQLSNKRGKRDKR